MASVEFDSIAAASGAATVEAVMTRMHDVFIAAGWTLEYADADAIGSSADPAEPAWDKTPATSTDAGIVVYRMPEQGSFTRWYVQLRPGWPGATNRAHMRGLIVGSTHDGSGTVTDGTPSLAPSPGTTITTSRQVFMNASEDGFFLGWFGGSSADVIVHVERLRLTDQSVQDPVYCHNRYGAHDGGLLSLSGGYTDQPNMLILTSFRFSTNEPDVTESVITSPFADTWLWLGPFLPVGDPLTGLPRLVRLAATSVVAADALVVVNVDGADRDYRAQSNNYTGSIGRLVVATE